MIYDVSEPIVRQYVILVESGKKTIDDVPDKFKEEVAGILNISLEERQGLEETVSTLESVMAVLLGKEV